MKTSKSTKKNPASPKKPTKEMVRRIKKIFRAITFQALTPAEILLLFRQPEFGGVKRICVATYKCYKEIQGSCNAFFNAKKGEEFERKFRVGIFSFNGFTYMTVGQSLAEEMQEHARCYSPSARPSSPAL